MQRLQLAGDRGHVLEEARRLLDRHLQHLVDVLAAVADLERLAVVALAVADVARHVHVRQEVHLDLDDAVALAGLAAAALDVEAEAPGVVAARACLRHLREQLAQRREQAGVGGRIGARRAPDRRLVDVDDAVDLLQALDALDRCGLERAPFRRAAACPNSVSMMSVDLPEPETPVTQVKRPSGMSALDVVQVVAARADDAQLPRRICGRAQPRHGDRGAAATGTGR